MAVAWANRLSHPYVRDVILELAKRGVTRAAVVALAQHSAHIYAEDARRAAEGTGIDVVCSPDWGQDAGLCTAFASRVATTLAASRESPVSVVMTAHSLPRSAIVRGDTYEREVRASADAVAETVRVRFGHDVRHVVAFQSQGMAGGGGGAVSWLGPDLRETFDELQRRGDRRVVVAPIGFLADHVEILYDLDVDARQMAIDRGLSYARIPSLNADADFIDVLACVARRVLHEGRREGLSDG
jgi:ferrochelatase